MGRLEGKGGQGKYYNYNLREEKKKYFLKEKIKRD